MLTPANSVGIRRSLCLVAAALLAYSQLSASNLAMRLKKSLATEYVAGSGPRGDNWIALPYRVPWSATPGAPPRAKDLCSARFANSPSVTLIRLDAGTGIPTSFNCLFPANHTANFMLTDQPRGILVHITAASPGSIVLLGYPDDTKPLPTIYGSFVSPGPRGDNWIALPYHCAWTRAEQVCIGLGLTLGTANITRIEAIQGATNTHNCGLSGNDFELVPGEAIRIRKTSPGDIVGVIPPHR